MEIQKLIKFWVTSISGANGKVSRLYLVSVHFCSISLSWSNISLFRRVLMGVSGSSGLSFLFPSHYQPYGCFKFLPVNSQRAGLNFNWFLSRRKNFSTEWKHFQHKMGCLNAHINLFWKGRIYAKTDCLPDSVPVLCVCNLYMYSILCWWLEILFF